MADLNKKAMELLQEHWSVLEYSNELQALWKEINFYRPLLTDPKGREYALKGRTYQFVTSLRPKFETVRSLLFNRENPLSFNESVVQIIREGLLMSVNISPPAESQVCTLKSQSISTFEQASNTGQPQSSNMKSSSNQTPYQKRSNLRKKGDFKDSQWCDFCQRHQHTRETCWKLHGRPAISQIHVMLQQNSGNWQPSTHYLGNVLQPSRDKGEMYRLRDKIKQLEAELIKSSSIIGSNTVANFGKNFILSKFFTLNVSVEKSDPREFWIIDTGATDDMTPILSYFTSYIPCPNTLKVQTTDDTLLTVVGIGTVNLHSIGNIEHVLYVLNLCISLVSVQRIASLIPYKIEFDGINAFLCDKVQGLETGLARIHASLYYLPSFRGTQKPIRSTSNNEGFSSSALATMATRNKEEHIWLIHRRLGHPSFQVLKLMYLEVFQGIQIEHFVCDVCEKAKHKRHSYVLENSEKRKTPFDLIHSDV